MENLEELCIGELSSILYRQYQLYLNRAMKPHGVQFSECAYLIKVPDVGSVPQTYIAKKLFCDNAIVTRSFQTLEKKGLVVREKSQEDRREVLVSLTPQGRRVKQAGLEVRQSWKDKVMVDITKKEEQALMKAQMCMVQRALRLPREAEEEKR